MSTDTRSRLAEILAAIEVLSPAAFAFAGERRDAAPGQSAPADPSRPALLAALAQELYRRCYCRPFPGARKPAAPPTADPGFLRALSAANAGREGWDPAWQVVSAGAGGEVVARKGRVTRRLQPGEYLVVDPPGGGPRPGASVSLYLPRESLALQEGFLYAFGETPPAVPNNERLLRFYWSVEAAGVPGLLAATTRELNRFAVPFRLKCLTSPALYDRLDAVVLFVDQSLFPIVVRLLGRLWRAAAAHLRASTPLFTRRLAAGLAFAEDPGGGWSFGNHRCGLLAEAIWEAHLAGARSAVECLRLVDERFQRAGLSLDRPYLSAGSHYPYAFPDDLAPPAAEEERGPDAEAAGGEGGPPRATRAGPPASASPPPAAEPPPAAATTPDGGAAGFLAAAEAIGARLCRDALWQGGRCTWLGAAWEPGAEAWREVHRTLPPDLYRGTGGLALFLARLSRASGERLFRATALGALEQALARRDEVPPASRGGFYSGWGGIGWAALEVAETLGRDDAAAAGRRLLAGLEPAAGNGAGLDLIDGSAGAVAALLRSRRPGDGDRPLELAVRHGERLLAAAQRDDAGWSWLTLPAGETDGHGATGLAHGAAGIALMLAELGAATGEERFLDAAREGFRYERRWFDPEQGNWADLRRFTRDPETGRPTAMVAWCHGAAGIALTRLRAWRLLGGEDYRREAATALATTAASLPSEGAGGAAGFSLCHGAAGNAEILLEAGRILAEPSLGARAAAVGRWGLAAYPGRRLPWPSGLPTLTETPGLMLGLAGIGHFYLRLADPERTPTLLLPVPEPAPPPRGGTGG